ncbi:hypothetical protein P261_02832 [Lachnospiraceae bacterium TWA4]|nr:hypothetical protein P261_02832 [Lachnospiraceae bacterium TWA4]
MVSVKKTTKKSFASEEETPEIEGVVVIAEGADKSEVKTQICETIQALFGVPLHKIKVLKGEF